MKLKKTILLLTVCILVAAGIGKNTVFADTVDDVRSVIDGIAMFKMSECGAGSLQEWADGAISDGAGTDTDAYAYALYKLGLADVSSYCESLERYLDENTVRSASTRLKYALCLCMKDPGHEYIAGTVDDSIGRLGIMSFVYGLHLANNGVVGTAYTPEQIALEILAMQHPDGGWSVMGQFGDVDVTAMVLQAFAGLGSGSGASKNTAIEAASQRAVRFLSEKQNEDGGYSGFGNENAESTAQVLIALSSLGIDAAKDARFVKNGHTVIDGIIQYRLPDGSFAHIDGGGSDPTATSQVFTAMASYICSPEGGSYYMVGKPRSSSPVDVARKAGSDDVTGEKEESEIAAGTSTLENIDDFDSTRAQECSENTAGTSTLENIDDFDSTRAQECSENTDETVDRDSKDDLSESDANGKDGSGTAGDQEYFASGTSVADNKENPGGEGSNIKHLLFLGILGIAIVASAVLFVFRKRNPKNFLFILIVAGIAATVVFFSDFATGTDYYRSETLEGEIAGEVTFTIRCDTIAGLGDSEFIPEDGCILKETTYAFAQDETVYDILVRAVKDNKLHMEKKKTGSGTHDYYICGIANIYEYDWGELSGWMYYVNGESPSVGCGQYHVKDGDRIEWLYTREIGRDLKGTMDMLTGEYK